MLLCVKVTSRSETAGGNAHGNLINHSFTLGKLYENVCVMKQVNGPLTALPCNPADTSSINSSVRALDKI